MSNLVEELRTVAAKTREEERKREEAERSCTTPSFLEDYRVFAQKLKMHVAQTPEKDYMCPTHYTKESYQSGCLAQKLKQEEIAFDIYSGDYLGGLSRPGYSVNYKIYKSNWL